MYKIETSDLFNKDKLSLMWQTPANKTQDFYKLEGGLTLYCNYFDQESSKALNLYPNSLLTKIAYYSFSVATKVKLNLVNDGDEVGLCYMGRTYAYISIKRINGKNHLLLSTGEFKNDDTIIYDEIIEDNELVLNMKYIKPDTYQFGVNNKYFKNKFIATAGTWVGGKYGIFARGYSNSNGYSKFEYFKVKEKNYEK